MNKYDVIIVGAGPAGIFCAYELIIKNPKLKIRILESGKELLQRDRKIKQDIMQGWAGAGAFSDGKLVSSTEATYGGNLQEYITNLNDFSSIMSKVDDIYMSFSKDKNIKVYGEDTDEVNIISRKAAQNGMTLLTGKVRHLGSDNNLQIMQSMYEYLKDKIEIYFETKVNAWYKNENDFTIFSATNFNSTNIQWVNNQIISKYLILTPGRSGMQWFEEEAKKNNLQLTNNQIDIGVRVEFPSWIGRNIDEYLYEPKLVWRTPKTDLKCRTFCYNVNGFVTQEAVGEITTVNGHSNSLRGERSPNNNFALLVSSTFTEPFKEPTLFGKSVAQTTNLLGNGIVVQRLKDLRMFRRSTEKRMSESNIVRTLKEATPGDISYCLPYKIVHAILESFDILDTVFKGINNGETLLYAPEIKFYSSRVKLNSSLETEIPNLFAGGDGCGVSRGLMQASMCGLVIADEINRRKG